MVVRSPDVNISCSHLGMRVWPFNGVLCLLDGQFVEWFPLSLCNAQWTASSSCACFLARLKGCFCCFWHPAIPLPLQCRCQAGRKKLVTWPLQPCPRPLPPCGQQKVCSSGAPPGSEPPRSLWCHDRHAFWVVEWWRGLGGAWLAKEDLPFSPPIKISPHSRPAY